jgi:hypothetical protein
VPVLEADLLPNESQKILDELDYMNPNFLILAVD